jgi:DNA-binding transcriptional LysR family regulator
MESFIGSREIDDSSTHRFPTLSFHRKKWPKAKISFSSNSISLHKRLVLAGEGISILPGFAIGRELKKGGLVDLYPKKVFEWPLLRFSHKSSRV